MVNRPTVLPPQGTPGQFDARNPTLIPNFDRNAVRGAGSVQPPTVNHSSPAGHLAANPRNAATAVATIGGTVTTDDEITLQIANATLPGGLLSKTYTAVDGDTVGTIAEALADLFNDDPVAAQHDIMVDAAGAVLTFNHTGPVGNFSTLSVPLSEPATITVGGTARTGDSLNVLFTGPQLGAGVLVRFNTTTGNTPTQGATGLAAAINANTALAALGITASPAAAIITLTVPATVEPVGVASWAQTNAPTLTIGGTLTVGDHLQATFTNAALPGGSRVVSYTTVLGDTTTTMAAGLATAINADAVLIAAGITASPAAAIITISFQPANGPLTFSGTVTGGATETMTFTTAATETLVTTSTATETVALTPSNGALSGGTGPVFASNNFEFAPAAGGISAFYYGQPYDVGYDVLAQMVQQGMPIV